MVPKHEINRLGRGDGMQRMNLSKKNHITWIGAILIVIGFAGELVFKNEVVAVWPLQSPPFWGLRPLRTKPIKLKSQGCQH
jgi:hypothetical protein